MDIYRLCMDAGIHPDPSYYSGRGATTSDLNDTILTRIHEAVVRGKGVEAGKAFIAMVAALPEASATAFLNGLFALEARGWVWDTAAPKPSSIAPDNMGSAFATVVEVLGRSRQTSEERLMRDAMVRAAFLSRHGVRDPRFRRTLYGF